MPEAAPRAIKLFGTAEPPAETRTLTAGPLSVELDAGNLRYIRYRGHEAIRAIAYVVRDRYWGTFNPAIDGFDVEETAAGFTVRYTGECGDDAQRLRYEATIRGSLDGSLVFSATGTALSTFLTNRTGFVVLHPIDGVSGRPVTVTHVDGRVVESEFPEIIDPKQPIMDIRALAHEVTAGICVTCTMEGDTFEMEDQRNWTDASYKTYVRPIGLPFPYTLTAGERTEQSVRITFSVDDEVSPAVSGGPVQVSVGAAAGRVPAFAMALERRHAAAVPAQRESLAALAPAFVSCYLDARDGALEGAIRDFAEAGAVLGADLALEVVVERADELHAVASAVTAAGVRVASVAVSLAADLDFVMPGTVFGDTQAFDELFATARAAFPGAPLGGGSFAYFTELNRKPPPFGALDFVCHTTCAIVHAADDRSVSETLECLPYLVRSGRALFGRRRYRLGPGGIGSRTSPFGAEPTPNPDAARVTMTRQDPRQRGLLGAAWHLGFAARMADGGVDEVVLGAPLGPFGLVHHREDYAQPWFDDAGGLFPTYHVARGLYAASGAELLGCTSSAPRDVLALAYRNGARTTLWVANLGAAPREVAIEGLPAGVPATLRLLDETTFEACNAAADGFDAGARTLPDRAVALGAYAVARIDLG